MIQKVVGFFLHVLSKALMRNAPNIDFEIPELAGFHVSKSLNNSSAGLKLTKRFSTFLSLDVRGGTKEAKHLSLISRFHFRMARLSMDPCVLTFAKSSFPVP